MNLPNDIQVIYFKSYISDLIQISQMVGGIARKQMVWNLIRFQRLLGRPLSRSRQVHVSEVVWTIPSKKKVPIARHLVRLRSLGRWRGRTELPGRLSSPTRSNNWSGIW